MITKTLTAGVLAVTLALTSVAPTTASAQMSDEDAIAGIVALLLFGAAVHHSRNNNRADPVTVEPREPRHHPRPSSQPQWRILPSECLQEATRANGRRIEFFGQRCLNRNYAFSNRLPNACHVRFQTANGHQRQGYRARCMREAGFRTSRR